MTSDDLIRNAQRWLEHDPDLETRAELQQLVDQRSPELAERFAGPLRFGTAGLRGIIGAGESRMNCAVVRRVSAGLARHVLQSCAGDTPPTVVVGYDGRQMSERFAAETAGVLCAAGVRAQLSAGPCPTPLVAFAVRKLAAAAGVMVTASHNPPEYNGYKVYDDAGALIVPPTDRSIAEGFEQAPAADEVPTMDLDEAARQGVLTRFGAELDHRYLEMIQGLITGPKGDRTLQIATTALHGVGDALLGRALADAGFPNVQSVPEQAEPDGAFPTVAFPNPEEPGAMDLVLALARATDADLVLANDPDADRLAAAVRREAGEYVQLSGNELGALLGHFMLTDGTDVAEQRLVLTTVVSSPLLGVMAAQLGARYAETLTGHKWIAHRGMDIEAKTGAKFVFGYEEALGYALGTAVRDKDGICAALALASLAARLRTEGQTLLDRLDQIGRQFGLFVSSQRAVRLPGSEGRSRIEASMARLRQAPPTELAGARVEAVVDYLAQTRTEPGGASRPAQELPSSNVLAYELAGGHRATARPSGTEPKIKLYFDAREQIAPEETRLRAAERARERLALMERELVARAGLDD